MNKKSGTFLKIIVVFLSIMLLVSIFINIKTYNESQKWEKGFSNCEKKSESVNKRIDELKKSIEKLEK